MRLWLWPSQAEAGRVIQPADPDWMAHAAPVAAFTLDAGFEAPAHCPGWILPDLHGPGVPLTPPEIPVTAGFVLTADALPREAALLQFYRQLPRLTLAQRRSEAARWKCLGCDVLIVLPGGDFIHLDMFGPGVSDARDFLRALSDPLAAPYEAYNNLDQGWAVEMHVGQDAVFVIDYDWEGPPGARHERASRFDRAEMTRQAAASLSRLEHLHRALVEDRGMELWQAPGAGQV